MKKFSLTRYSVFKLIALLLGTLMALLLAEATYRVWHYAMYRNLKDVRAGSRPPPVQPGKEMKLGQMIQLSKYLEIVYELIPSSNYQFMGAPVQTNAMGFRDHNYPKVPSKKVRRIVGLGDSVMFGWGVSEPDCYLARLENDLNRQDSVVFEIINTGVPGYNTVMEVATLRHKINLSDVDLVILNFVGNDLELPDFIRNKSDYLDLTKSLILQRFESYDGLDRNLLSDQVRDKKDLDEIPTEYHPLVGEVNFNRAMKELRELATMHHFKVLVLSTETQWGLPDYVSSACKTMGFDLLHIQPVWEKYKAENPGAEWHLNSHDGHPNVLGHKIIADTLRKRLPS